MPIRNPQSWLKYSFQDHTRETSHINIPTLEYSALLFPELLTRVGQFRNALAGITNGNIVKETLTSFDTKYFPPVITDPNVQREQKWLVSWRDTNNWGETGRVEIPTAQLTDGDGSLLVGNTELADLTHPAWVEFVEEFEWIARSPQGSTVEITSIVLVHRNL